MIYLIYPNNLAALQTTEVTRLISDVENSDLEQTADINEAVSKFVIILETAAKQSLQLGDVKQKKDKPQSQPWFDHECGHFRKHLNFVSNKKRTNPFDEQTRLNHYSFEKDYKTLLRLKKTRTVKSPNLSLRSSNQILVNFKIHVY